MPIAEPAPLICPGCGCVNDARAVFCSHPECHKALGEFKYAMEELGKQSKWHVTLVDKCANFIGRPHFVALHVTWIVVWIAVNTGIFFMGKAFDVYPFGLLALALSIEAVLITSILIMSNRGQTELANTRAALDYEVNIQTYREIQQVLRALDQISERLDRLEGL